MEDRAYSRRDVLMPRTAEELVEFPVGWMEELQMELMHFVIRLPDGERKHWPVRKYITMATLVDEGQRPAMLPLNVPPLKVHLRAVLAHGIESQEKGDVYWDDGGVQFHYPYLQQGDAD